MIKIIMVQNEKTYESKELLKRFLPYFKKYKFVLFMDLFCAALTTLCELVLPLIMRYITNEGIILDMEKKDKNGKQYEL